MHDILPVIDRIARTWISLCAAVLVAVLAIANPVCAQTKKPTPALLPRDLAVRFQTADLDNSDSLTRDEAIKGGFSSDRFEAVDRDGDHIITVVEIVTYLSDRASEWAGADRDGDGSISAEEAAASPGLKSIFTAADYDGDGVLRKQEHEAWANTSLYQNVDLPYVVPNIINKKF